MRPGTQDPKLSKFQNFQNIQKIQNIQNFQAAEIVPSNIQENFESVELVIPERVDEDPALIRGSVREVVYTIWDFVQFSI